ncbi:hypothetical protein [Pedobacter sp. Bi126]|uniref:hypothetical protein n=1 Tax=Pedobacter sp. Bi126 TaxID=2822349 RepID=UPI001E325412|nr:hypothetical protein [Pedobacter sp. Bi126]
MDWSAAPVQNTQSLPVFRFYASLPRTSLLQGNASTGAIGPKQYFIFVVAGCAQTLVPKPDWSGHTDSS